MGFDRLIAMASEVDKRRKSAENSPVQDGTSPRKSASIPLGVEEELRKKIEESFNEDLEARNLSVLKEKDQEIAEPNIQVKGVEQMAEEMAEDVTEEMRRKFEEKELAELRIGLEKERNELDEKLEIEKEKYRKAQE